MDNSARVSSVQFIPYGAQRSLASSSVAAFPTDITAAKAKKAFAHVDSVLKRLADEEEAILGKRPIIPSAPNKAKDFSLPSIPLASRRSVTVPTRTSAQHNITAELTLPPIPQDVATFASKQLQSANTEYVRSYSVSHPTQPPVPPAAPPATAAANVANSIERDFRQKAAERRRIAAEAQRLKHAETCPRCARRSQIGEQFLEIKEKVRVAREAGGVRPATTPRSRPASGPSCILSSRKGNSFDKSSGPDAGDIANDENIQTIDVRRRRNLPGSDDNYHNCRHHSTDRGYRRSHHHGGSSSDNESCCHRHHGHHSGGRSPHDMPQSSASPRRATISESLVSTSPTLNSFYDRFGNRHRLLSPSERAERAEQRRNNLKDNYTCCRRIGCAGYMGETGGVFYIDNDGNRHEHCPHRRSRHTAEEEGQDPDESVSSHASSGVDDHLTSKQDKEEKRWRRISLAAAKRKSVSPLDISDGPHVNVRKYTGTLSGTFGKSKRFSYSGHDVNEPVYYRRRGRNSGYDNDGSDSDSRDSWDGNTGIAAKGRRKGNEGRIPYRRSGEAHYDDGRMGNHPSRSRRDHSGGSGRDSRRFGGGWGQSKTTSRSPNRKPPRLTPAQERRQARLHQSQWEKDRLAREARMARKRLAKEREEAEILAKQRAIEEAERLEKERLLAEWEADQARKHNAEQQDRRHFLQEYQNRIETHKGTRPGLEKKLATLSAQLEAAPSANAEVLRELEDRIASRKAQLAAAATASTDARDAANGARRLIFESGDECEALLRHIRAARIDQITSFVGKGTTSLLTLRDLLVPGNDAESLSATNSPTKLPKGEFEDIDSAEVFNRSNSRSDGNSAKRSAHQNRNGSSPTSASASTEKNILNKWKLAATSIADIADEIRSRFSAANNTLVEEQDPHDVSNGGVNPLSPNSISRTSTFMGRMEESSEVQNVKTQTQKNINVVTNSRDKTTTTNVPMHISASRKKCLRLGHEWALAFLEAADLVALRGGKCPMCLHEEEEEEYLLATTQPVAHKKSDDLTTQMFLEAATPNTLTLEGGKRLGIGRMHSKSHSDSHRTVSGHSTLTAAHQSSSSSESESSANELGKRVNNRDKQPVDSSAMFISINVGDQTAPPISLAAPNATDSHSRHHHQRAGSLSNSLIGLLGEGQLPPTEVDITTVDHKRAKNKQRRGKEANGGDAPAPAPSREEINRRVAAIVAAASKSNVLTSLAVNESPTKSPKKQTSKQSARKPSRATDGRNDSFLNTSNSGTFADFGNGEANSQMSMAALTADMLAPYRRQVLRALVFEAAKSREEFSRWKEVGEHAARNLEAKRAVAKAMMRDEVMRHAIGYQVPKSFEDSKNKQHQPFELESLNSVANPTFPVQRTSNNSELLTSSLFNGTQRPQPVVETSSNSIDRKTKIQLNARSLVEAIRDVNAKLETATRLQEQRTYGGDYLWGDSDAKHATEALNKDSIFQQREVTVRHVSPMRGPAAAAYERLTRLRSIDAGNHLVRSTKPLCPQPPAGGNARPTALRIRELPLVANGGTPINFLRSALDV